MKLISGEALLRALAAEDRTQAQLARKVGCSRQFIHLLIHNKSTGCERETAEAIERALNAPMGSLFVPEQWPDLLYLRDVGKAAERLRAADADRRVAEEATRAAVHIARTAGWPWEKIAHALGLSEKATRERYS